MKRLLLMLTLSSVVLTGCWDQHLIKDARISYASAFDLTDDGKVKATASIRGFVAGGEAGGGSPRNEIVQAEGYNLRNIRMNIDRKISGTFTAAKNRVFLYSDEIAKQGLYPYLDIFYRAPSSSLNSKLAITKGESGRIIEIDQKENTLIGEYLEELIFSSEKHTVVPKIDVQGICPLFFEEGKDPFLPYLEYQEEVRDVEINGVALFNNDKMTGTLNAKDSTLLLLLYNKTSKETRLVRKVSNKFKQEIENYATVMVNKSKSKMKVTVLDDDTINASFNVKMQVNLIEYPPDHLTDQKQVDQMNKKLSSILTKDANAVLGKLKEAKSDPIGIGLELKAFHPKVWKKLKWKEVYPDIKTEAKVQVEIVAHGIIN